MRIVTVDDDKEFYGKLSRLPYLTTLISVPEELGRRIEIIRRELEQIDNRQIYHHPSYFHVTVKGLGWLGEDVGDADLTEIKAKIEEVAASTSQFSLGLGGLRVWPSVIYAEVEEGREQVRGMHLRIGRELRGFRVGHTEYEGERMHPHVAIATFAVRDADSLVREVKKFESTKIGTMRIDNIKLVKTIPRELSARSEERASFLEEIASSPLNSASSKP